MAEMALLAAAAGAWSVLRMVRCDRCGMPTGLAQALYRTITQTEACSRCRRLDVQAVEPPLPARFASDPEMARRGAEIRGAMSAMVWRQAADLREAQVSVARARDRE